MFKKLVMLFVVIALLGSLTACGRSVEQLVKMGQAAIGVVGEAYKDAKENVEDMKDVLSGDEDESEGDDAR